MMHISFKILSQCFLMKDIFISNFVDEFNTIYSQFSFLS